MICEFNMEFPMESELSGLTLKGGMSGSLSPSSPPHLGPTALGLLRKRVWGILRGSRKGSYADTMLRSWAGVEMGLSKGKM